MQPEPLAQLLAALGRSPTERMTVCLRPVGAGFRSVHTTVGDAPALVAANAADCDVWFSVQPLRAGISSGRGTASDVIGLRALYADIDYKDSGAGQGQALPLIGDLNRVLGQGPAAMVRTGHGLHPYWALRLDWAEDDGRARAAAQSLLDSWRRCVEHHATLRGVAVDPVFDLPRILRAPGSTNVKDPAQPVPVTLATGPSQPLDLAQVRSALAQWSDPVIPAPRREAAAADPWGGVPDAPRCFTAAQAARFIEPALERLRTCVPKGVPSVHHAVLHAAPILGHFVGSHWTREEVEAMVEEALAAAGSIGLAAGRHLATLRGGLDIGAADWQATRVEEVARSRPLASSGGAFFEKESGLQATVLLAAIEELGPVATGDGGSLWRYEGGVWRRDGRREVRHRAYELLGDRARKSHVETVVDIMISRPPRITDDMIETEFLNLPNGLLHWRTGQLLPHTPDRLVLPRVPAEWDPTAECPEVLKWAAQVFGVDSIEFVFEVVGYCLLNANPLHKAFLLHGSGANGKGTFLRLLTALLGADNCCAVTPQSLDDNRFAAADLYGCLGNLVGDVDPRMFKSTEVFKQITGGDLLRAERKYEQPFNFTARATLVAAFNALPRTADGTEGFFRRWVVVPFGAHFPAGIADPSIEEKMHAPGELRGLLRHAVAGLGRVMGRRAFALPASVLAAGEEFRIAADPLRAFLEEYAATVPMGWTPRTEVYRRYTNWASENGYQSLAASGFYERIESCAESSPILLSSRVRQGTRGFLVDRKGAVGAA